ncbi:MAG: hypothetical protein HONBIEJF_02969 [Fimbriimonadaceae bacterium]|nr:hypothetical protein [Fimbriimonadaceae bacterium]
MYKIHFKRTFLFAIIGLLAGLLYGLFSPKVYEGNAGMIVGTDQGRIAGGNSGFQEDVEQILRQGYYKDSETEAQVLRSQGVFFRALQRVAEKRGVATITDDNRAAYERYDVITPEKSQVALIQVRWTDPKIAAEIANEVTFVYNELRQQAMRDSVNSAIAYLEDQVQLARQKLTIKQNDLEGFKKSKLISDYAQKTMADEKTLSDYTLAAANLESEIQAIDAELSADRAIKARTPQFMQSTRHENKNIVLAKLESAKSDLEAGKVALLSRYLPDSIEVRNVNEQLAEVNRQLAIERKRASEITGRTQSVDPVWLEKDQKIAQNITRRQSVERRLQEMNSQLEEHKAKMELRPADEIGLLERNRDVGIASEQFQRLVRQLEDLKVRTDSAGRSAQLIFSAQVDEDPVAPDVFKMSFIGALAGICLGLIFSFAMESLKLRVHTSAQLSELTGLPVVAAVPKLPKPREIRLLRNLVKPEGQPSESFRYMSFFTLANDATFPKVVLFTGAGRQVGTSGSAAQFAVAMARAGTKTLLVDGDLRRQTVTKMFGAEGKPGVSDLLGREMLPSGQESAIEIATAHPGLMLLPAGSGGRTSLSAFQIAHIAAVVQQLRDKAQVIVIDAPPCDAFSDASALAKYVDDVCMVVSARKTPFRSIPLAYEILSRAGGKNISLVLTEASAQEEPFAEAARSLSRA